MSRIVLTHAPRHLPPWLIFDVRLQKSMNLPRFFAALFVGWILAAITNLLLNSDQFLDAVLHIPALILIASPGLGVIFLIAASALSLVSIEQIYIRILLISVTSSIAMLGFLVIMSAGDPPLSTESYLIPCTLAFAFTWISASLFRKQNTAEQDAPANP